jgi:hypothetical protein
MVCECILTFHSTNTRSSTTNFRISSHCRPIHHKIIRRTCSNSRRRRNILTRPEDPKEPRRMTRVVQKMPAPTKINIFDNNSNNHNRDRPRNSRHSICSSRGIFRFPICPISHKCAFPLGLPSSWATMTKEAVAEAQADEVVDAVLVGEEAVAEEVEEGEVEAEADIARKAMAPMTRIDPTMVRTFFRSTSRNSNSCSTNNTRRRRPTWDPPQRRMLPNSRYRG